MAGSAKRKKLGLLLEAEVAPGVQTRFEARYHAATGVVITPGRPQHYQNQPNKRGAELRVYFNDPGMAIAIQAAGIHVESGRTGYKAGAYRYRFSNNKLWWKFVEGQGLRLGTN